MSRVHGDDRGEMKPPRDYPRGGFRFVLRIFDFYGFYTSKAGQPLFRGEQFNE